MLNTTEAATAFVEAHADAVEWAVYEARAAEHRKAVRAWAARQSTQATEEAKTLQSGELRRGNSSLRAMAKEAVALLVSAEVDPDITIGSADEAVGHGWRVDFGSRAQVQQTVSYFVTDMGLSRRELPEATADAPRPESGIIDVAELHDGVDRTNLIRPASVAIAGLLRQNSII